jgi:hypothetical protein
MENNYKNWLRDAGNKILKYIFDIIPRGILHFFKSFPGWFQVFVFLLIIYYLLFRK